MSAFSASAFLSHAPLHPQGARDCVRGEHERERRPPGEHDDQSLSRLRSIDRILSCAVPGERAKRELRPPDTFCPMNIYILQGEEQLGPYTVGEINDRLARGQLTRLHIGVV